MKITRWRADRKPTQTEAEAMFKDEGLEYSIEEIPAGAQVKDHRHPFDEVRMVIRGAMRFNVAGNEFILREGDRLELPSNTKHWMKAEPESECISLFAHRVT